MCNNSCKGNSFRAMHLGMFYNLLPELLNRDHASAEQRWEVLAEMWVEKKKAKMTSKKSNGCNLVKASA